MEPFMGQIMQVGFSFAPRGWMTCMGQQIAISQNSALFSLLGTTFGGNGTQTFALPHAGGRTLVGTGQSPGVSAPYQLGQIGGSESTTLTQLNMPIHNHGATFTGALQALPVGRGELATETAAPDAGSLLGTAYEAGGTTTPTLYAPAGTAGTPVNLGGLTGSCQVAAAGGSQAFGITSPYLAVLTVIATQGGFPSRN